MTYYAVAMALTLVLSYCATTVYAMPNGGQLRGVKNGWIAFLVFLPLTFLLVFRWDVGVDSLYQGSYWGAYHASVLGENPESFEWGFFMLMRLFAELEVPFFWFLFALGLAFMGITAFAISRGTYWIRWSVLVFFLLAVYFDGFSSLRQSLAEAVCLVGWAGMAYEPPSRKKHARIILIFLAAALLHSIALMNIPVYLLCCVRFSRGTLLKVLVAAVILSPVLSAALRFCMTLIAGDEYTYMGVARINALMAGVLAVVCWYFYDEISALDENSYMFVNQAVGIFVLIMNSGAMYLPFRVFDMLKIGYIFIVPCLLRSIRSNKTRLFTGGVVLATFGAWFINYFFLQDSFAANYQWAFTNWSNIIRLP